MLRMRSGNRSRSGQMPLALVAVVLLMTGTFFGVVYADIERAADNSGNMETELVSLDREVEEAEFGIEAGLGRIIDGLSSSDEGGSLVDRAETFDGAVESYFERSFPCFNRGVSTHIVSHDISLGLETLRSDSDEFFTGGGCASFFRAEGTVTASFESESSSCVRVMEIEADATSGLPLVIESATRFELSGEGGMSMLTQMLEYQLSSLAQYRVMQGYGMSNGAGVGTDDIITAEDVSTAFRNAVSVLQTMFFRTNAEGDGELVRACQVDIAEMMTCRDGYLRVNVGSLFSQALLSGLDAYVVKWVDYLQLDRVLDLADSISDEAGKLWRGFVKMISGKDPGIDIIKDHIRNQIESLGLSEDTFMRPFDGKSVTVTVPSYTFTLDSDDERVEYTVEGGTVTVDLPDVDIGSWDGWNGFIDRYEDERNGFRESLKCIIRNVAYSIEDKIVYMVPVDIFDGGSFFDDYISTADAVLDLGDDMIAGCTKETVMMNRISDPMMIEVYKDVAEHADEIYRHGEFSESLRQAVDGSIYGPDAAILSGIPEDQMRDYELMVEECALVPGDEMYTCIRDDALDALRVIENAKDVNSGKITEIIASSAEGLIQILDLRPKVEEAIRDMYSEMLAHSCVSPFDGPIGLPAEGTFALMDENGNRYTESMTVTDTVELHADVRTPTERDDNAHMTAPGESRRAAYYSRFTVTLSATVNYTVRSSDPVHAALGLCDASYSGSFDVNTVLDIPCISAWALAGAEYKETNTLIGDLWNAVLDILEPVLEPLKKMFRAVQTASRLLSATVMEFASCLGDMVKELFETLMVPIQAFWDIAGSALQEVLDGIGIAAVDLTGRGQTLTIDLCGVLLTVHLNLASLKKDSKELITVSIDKDMGNSVGAGASVTLKERSGEVYPLVSARAHGGDWSFSITADPFQKQGDDMVTVSGRTRTVEYGGTMPHLVQYRETGVSLSDVPGIGTAVSNIPLPIPGVKGSIDAGVSLKYDIPMEPGLLINEVESNPAGTDRGNEWVEILNNTRETADLEGYVLYPESGRHKGVTLGDTVLAPGQRTVVTFPGASLNNSDERVILEDGDGNTVDATPSFSDGNNSDFTFQRIFDGSTVWKSLPGTPGARNGGGAADRFGIGPMMFDIICDSALDVLDEMGGRIDTVDLLCEYLQNVISRVIDTVIAMMAGCIIGVCVFLEVCLEDYTGSGHAGFRISLGFDGELAEDLVRHLLAMVPLIGKYVNNPEGMTAERILYQDIYLRVLFYTGASVPEMLGSFSDTEQDVGVSVRTNLAGLSQMTGDDRGDWKVDVGLVAENVPSELLSAVFDADPEKRSDLWLIDMHFGEAAPTDP